MRTHNREILLYYNPESSSHRKTVAYARSMVPHVKAYSFAQAPSTGTSWQFILDALQLDDPKQLMNKAHPYYQANLRGREFEDACWIKVIRKNPDLLRSPVAVRGARAVLCSTPTDIYKLTELSLV